MEEGRYWEEEGGERGERGERGTLLRLYLAFLSFRLMNFHCYEIDCVMDSPDLRTHASISEDGESEKLGKKRGAAVLVVGSVAFWDRSCTKSKKKGEDRRGGEGEERREERKGKKREEKRRRKDSGIGDIANS